MRVNSFDQVKIFFDENKCDLLENCYINAHVKMKYRCSCGNISFINFNNFKSGKRCGCKKINKKTLKEQKIKSKVEKKGHKFLKFEFINGKYWVDYICKCGEHRKKQISSINKSDGCSNCLRSKFSFTHDYVEKFFIDHGCKLLSDTYKNAKTKLKYICSCGNESEIVFDSFKRGNRCKKCSGKRSNIKISLSHEFVESFFMSAGCKLLETYKSANKPMQYECVCGNVSKISYSNFRLGKRCKKCFIERISGKNNYQWHHDRENHSNYLLFKDKYYKMLRITLKKFNNHKTCKTEKMLGYSALDLQKFIENHSNWNNVKNEKWSIDHIFPIKAFWDYNISDPSIINGLDNLQPLCHIDNIRKSDKYDAFLFADWLKNKGVIYVESRKGRRKT